VPSAYGVTDNPTQETFSGGKDQPNYNPDSQTEESSSTPDSSTVPDETAPATTGASTDGQQRAFARAKSYLGYSAFSRSGLIEQ